MSYSSRDFDHFSGLVGIQFVCVSGLQLKQSHRRIQEPGSTTPLDSIARFE